MQDLTILYLQSDLVWENPAMNRELFAQIIRQHTKNEDLIVLPETFTTGFPVDPTPFAETSDGKTIRWMKEMADETGAAITGSFLFTEKNRYYNRLIWMNPGGSFEKYDKRHVFSMGGEDKKITKGKNKIIINYKGWRIRPLICYDLRFPVWCKNTIDETGNFEYDLMIFVANWPSQRAYPWKMLLIARAIENQAFVLGVNRVGHDGTGNYYRGDSMMIDPKGNILSEAEPDIEAAVSTTVSMEELIRFRKKFMVGNDWDIFEIKD